MLLLQTDNYILECHFIGFNNDTWYCFKCSRLADCCDRFAVVMSLGIITTVNSNACVLHCQIEEFTPRQIARKSHAEIRTAQGKTGVTLQQVKVI